MAISKKTRGDSRKIRTFRRPRSILYKDATKSSLYRQRRICEAVCIFSRLLILAESRGPWIEEMIGRVADGLKQRGRCHPAEARLIKDIHRPTIPTSGRGSTLSNHHRQNSPRVYHPQSQAAAAVFGPFTPYMICGRWSVLRKSIDFAPAIWISAQKIFAADFFGHASSTTSANAPHLRR